MSTLRLLGALCAGFHANRVLAGLALIATVTTFSATWASADQAAGTDWLDGYMIEPPVLVGPPAPRLFDSSADPADLWDRLDGEFQVEVEASIASAGLGDAVKNRKLAVALVDVTEVDQPRVAAVNGDTMMYAASMPKIAILLAAFQKERSGGLVIDGPTSAKLERMIRRSSNTDATDMMRTVGRQYIARVLMSRRYRLYDPEHNGGLWVGKDYAKVGAWRRDPLYNLSHAATALQTARFYYLLEAGRLVSPSASRRMKGMLGDPGIDHKFVRGLRVASPEAVVYRKSGSWGAYHSDSALVEHCGKRYIAVGMAESTQGDQWLSRLIVALDRVVCPVPGSLVNAPSGPRT